MAAAQESLAAAVEAVGTSDEWMAFLAFSAKLHAYSANNRFWLFMQAQQRGWDDLGMVAGFNTWKALGRSVRKGEKGLTVLAPCRVKVTDETTGEDRYALAGFKIEHVFAARQTDGEGEIPEPIRPELLTGAGPDGAFRALTDLVEAHGFTVTRAPLTPANGTTSFATRVVTVADRLEDAAAVKTLAHELAHVMLHENEDYHGNRGRCEVEAESVAYLVCADLGMSTDAYSFPYVAAWANGETRTVTAAADKAITTATAICEALASADTRELVAA
jgi:antirestriction protein ArdC